MRLIDANAKMVAQLNDFETESVVEKEMTVDDYLSLSDYDATTIDAVPVVRCKDCNRRYITGSTTHYYVCDFMDAEYNDNGYCHHGERKDDDTD